MEAGRCRVMEGYAYPSCEEAAHMSSVFVLDVRGNAPWSSYVIMHPLSLVRRNTIGERQEPFQSCVSFLGVGSATMPCKSEARASA